MINLCILAGVPARAQQAFLPVDDSLLKLAPPLKSHPVAAAIRNYQLLPSVVDRRFSCLEPISHLQVVVEISHLNDQAHTTTLQIMNENGVIESSFLTTALRLPHYPDVHLDSYKIRFGEELSTLVINARRENKNLNRVDKTKSNKQLAQALLKSDQQVQLLSCQDELLNPQSLQALDSDWMQGYQRAKFNKNTPQSVCAIRDENKKIICSAVLIAPNLALTANHCLMKLKNTPSTLACSDSEVSEIDSDLSVQNEEHLQNQWKVSSDIAILKLKDELKTPPALLASTASEGADLLFTSQSCALFGYGRQIDIQTAELHGVEFAPPPEELGGLQLSIDNYQLEKLISSDPRYFMRPGDSGGGVICEQNDHDIVVGIHSLIYPIDSTVNSVSVGHNYQWLIEQIEKLHSPW